MMRSLRCAGALLLAVSPAAPPDAVAGSGPSIETLDDLWDGFDPRALPLEEEVFEKREEDGLLIERLYFTGEIWEGEKVRIYAIRGAPQDGRKLPGVVHIHGGGQTANAEWVRFWARRGCVSVTFDFCGDTNLPSLGPEYRREHFTRWGRVPADMMEVGGGTSMEPTPRHNPWIHWCFAARRALTLIERHPQVDPERLGIFGISVGGTLTWLVAGIDARVRAAVPIYGCGWNSYGYPPDLSAPVSDEKEKWRRFVAPETYAPRVRCPLLFLSATNDNHGKMDLAFRTLDRLGSEVHRQLFTPRYNHHIEPEEARSLPLWMEWHLQGGPAWPASPEIRIRAARIPEIEVSPDRSEEVERVEIYYSLDNPWPASRFWRRAERAARKDGVVAGAAPFPEGSETIYAFANATYRSGVSMSSRLLSASIRELAGAEPTLEPELLIDDMSSSDDWYYVPAYTDPNRDGTYFRPWSGPDGEAGFTLNESLFSPQRIDFEFATHKIGDPQWRGRGRRALLIDCFSAGALERLQIKAVIGHFRPEWKDYRAVPDLGESTSGWTTLRLLPEDLRAEDGSVLPGWEEVDCLALEGTAAPGKPPVFRRLRWEEAE